MSAAYKVGKVCAKHPELEGQRYASNATCPKCNAEGMKRRRAANPNSGGTVVGKPCPAHPELEGLRYTANRCCVSCNSNMGKK